MEDFKINITADATSAVAEAKATQEALKQVANTSTAAGEESSKAAQKATGKHQELKQALGSLGRAFPELGAIARLAFNPLAMGATMLMTALSKVRGNIVELGEMVEFVPWEGFSTRAKKAAAAVAEIRDMAKEAEEASARLMDVFRARESAEAKMDAARKRLELAQARSIEDPARRAEAEAEIEDRYARRELEREERGRQMKIAEQERRARELRDNEKRLGGSLNVALERQAKIGTPEDIEGRLAAMRKNLAAEEAALAKAEDKYEKFTTGFGGFMNQGVVSAGARQRAEENIEGQRTTVDRLRRMVREDEARLGGAQQLDAWIGAAQGRMTGMRQSRAGIEAMLPTQRQVAGIESAAARGVFRVEGQERAMSARNEAAAAANKLVQELISAIEANKGVDQRVSQELESWRSWKKQMEQRIGGQR